MFKNALRVTLALFAGLALGLVLLETSLHLNPRLLLRGMAVPAPVYTPVQEQIYDVHYSDGDIFFWQPELVQPIPLTEDRLEGTVHFQTDEFGFPNQAPLPPQVDIIVLGRSHSLGAQASQPWTHQLMKSSGLSLLNLSQTGAGTSLKRDYLKKFGLPRQPRWAVVGILPALDIIGYSPNPNWLVPNLAYPVIQHIYRRFNNGSPKQAIAKPIYPLQIDIPGQTVELTFYTNYLSTLTIEPSEMRDSQQWASASQELVDLIQLARKNKVCVILLYVPTKPDIYFPLAEDASQLELVLDTLAPWRLDSTHTLVQDPSFTTSIRQMQSNAGAARGLLIEFARQQGVLLADPSQALTQAALQGDAPYMLYDTHWSVTGHRIVAQTILEIIQNASCP
ncbi:MAG: hypothetical protein AB1894_01965 [Chloroflexota bacterium]